MSVPPGSRHSRWRTGRMPRRRSSALVRAPSVPSGSNIATPSLNSTVFWNTDFSSGIGFIPTSFVTTGIVGALAWIAFLVLLIVFGFRMLILRAPRGCDLPAMSRYSRSSRRSISSLPPFSVCRMRSFSFSRSSSPASSSRRRVSPHVSQQHGVHLLAESATRIYHRVPAHDSSARRRSSPPIRLLSGISPCELASANTAF